MRFAAFISYSHHDQRWAHWLHRRLESYRAPRGVTLGRAGSRIGRVFLDRSELATSGDLGRHLEEALAASDNLVVVCSPASARSRWVNEEVRRFRARGRGDRIFCLIVDGDPARSPGEGGCFAPALVEDDRAAREPLAADVRTGADGRGDAFLKLVAGLADLRFDQLKRRETVRRQRRLFAVAAAASTLAVLLAGLAIAAWLARNEARRQAIAADQTADFLRSLFQEADPDRTQGQAITPVDMLHRGAARLLSAKAGFGGLRGQPLVRADMLITVAELELQLGDTAGAERVARIAAATAGLPPVSRGRLARLFGAAALTRSDYPAARTALDGGLKALPADEFSLRAAMLRMRGQVEVATGRTDEAVRDLRLAETIATINAPDPPAALHARLLRGIAENSAGDYAAASADLRHVITAWEQRGELNHPQRLEALNELGTIDIRQGRHHDAEALFRQALAIQQHVLGPDHPEAALTASNLGRALVEGGRFAEARDLLLRARRIFVRQMGPDLDTLANLDDSLGIAEAALGDPIAAEASFADGLRIARLHDMPKQIELLTDRAELRCRAGSAAPASADIAAARAALAHYALTEPWRGARIDAVAAACAPGGPASRVQLRAALPLIAKRWGEDGLFTRRAEAALRT